MALPSPRIAALRGCLNPVWAFSEFTTGLSAAATEPAGETARAILPRLGSQTVSAEPANWQRLRRPGFMVELSHPPVTPQGHAVEQVEERAQDHRGDIERVHLSSPESGELYFEVARFRGLTPNDEYLSHARYLARRFGSDSVGPLLETTIAGRQASTYSIRWPDHERSVVLSPSATIRTASSTTRARS